MKNWCLVLLKREFAHLLELGRELVPVVWFCLFTRPDHNRREAKAIRCNFMTRIQSSTLRLLISVFIRLAVKTLFTTLMDGAQRQYSRFTTCRPPYKQSIELCQLKLI